MSCDRSEQVHAYHDGQLGPVGRAELEDHLAGCAGCAQLLAELRVVSRLISSAAMPTVPAPRVQRYYEAWDVSRQRGLLRTSSWLTGAAAAVLVGSLVLWPKSNVNTASAVVESNVAWETVAVMPPPERGTDRPDEFIELAQWIAEDLSAEGVQ